MLNIQKAYQQGEVIFRHGFAKLSHAKGSDSRGLQLHLLLLLDGLECGVRTAGPNYLFATRRITQRNVSITKYLQLQLATRKILCKILLFQSLNVYSEGLHCKVNNKIVLYIFIQKFEYLGTIKKYTFEYIF